MNGDKYTVLDAEHLSTGEVASVRNTPFDFTSFKAIGKDISSDDTQLAMSQGYDCSFMIDGELAAVAESPRSGLRLSVYSDMPALQFYSGNYLGGVGKSGVYSGRQGFCLEPQFVPDAVNIPHFEAPLLKKGEIKRHYIRYEFQLSD